MGMGPARKKVIGGLFARLLRAPLRSNRRRPVHSRGFWTIKKDKPAERSEMGVAISRRTFFEMNLEAGRPNFERQIWRAKVRRKAKSQEVPFFGGGCSKKKRKTVCGNL